MYTVEKFDPAKQDWEERFSSQDKAEALAKYRRIRSHPSVAAKDPQSYPEGFCRLRLCASVLDMVVRLVISTYFVPKNKL